MDQQDQPASESSSITQLPKWHKATRHLKAFCFLFKNIDFILNNNNHNIDYTPFPISSSTEYQSRLSGSKRKASEIEE